MNVKQHWQPSSPCSGSTLNLQHIHARASIFFFFNIIAGEYKMDESALQSSYIAMNIQEGEQKDVAVFWLLSHGSLATGSTAGQTTEEENERGFRINCFWL